MMEKLKGWRGILLSWAIVGLTWGEQALSILGSFTAGGNIVSLDHVVGAMLTASILTVKLWITDALPRLKGETGK